MNNINVNIFLLILLTSKTLPSSLLMTRIEILLMLFINIKVNNIYINNVNVQVNNFNVNNTSLIYVNITT